MADAPYSFDFMETITDCAWGSNWIQAKMQVLPQSAGQNSVLVTQTFPGLSGGTPGFTYMTSTVPAIALPLFSAPMTQARLTATVKPSAGLSLTGFGARLPATPPPAPPGGAAGYWFKITPGLIPGNSSVRIRFNFSGLTNGAWTFSVATSKKLSVGMTFDEPDFFSFAQTTGSHGGGDVPPATVDFVVNTETLQVTLL
jgi:hypothetical protein